MTAILSSDIWAGVLATSIARSVISVPAISGGKALSWTVFSRGPVTVAYPRFPIGLVDGDEGIIANLPAVGAHLRDQGVKLLRMSAPESLLVMQPAITVEARLPETVIPDLRSWAPQHVPASLRRKFRQGQRAGLVVVPADAGDGATLYSLYARTVARQRGSIRYNRRYFEALSAAAVGCDALTVAKVMTAEGDLAAFVAVAHDAGTAYYLHGGYADRFSALRPGYFAMGWALQQAQAKGDCAFNFLTSPLGQPALLEYKESFGGRSSPRCHWQVPLTLVGRIAASALRLMAATPRNVRMRAQASASNNTSA